jgi:hypothetical protein
VGVAVHESVSMIASGSMRVERATRDQTERSRRRPGPASAAFSSDRNSPALIGRLWCLIQARRRGNSADLLGQPLCSTKASNVTGIACRDSITPTPARRLALPVTHSDEDKDHAYDEEELLADVLE